MVPAALEGGDEEEVEEEEEEEGGDEAAVESLATDFARAACAVLL